MSAARNKGTRWESCIVDFLIGEGWPHAERRALNGIRDKGDIAGLPGVVIEAKDHAGHNSLAGWVDEATREAANAGADHAVVWHKRRGRASAGDGYVTMTGETYVALLRAAGYGVT